MTNKISKPLKNNKFIYYFIIWLSVSIIGIYFRLYPLRNFVSNDLSEKASLLVIANLKKSADYQIEKQYPLAGTVQKSILSKRLFDEMLKKQSSDIRIQIDKASKALQNINQSNQKTPYLLESDPFYYYSLTENILKTGKIGQIVQGSKYLNDKMLAPAGHWEPFTLHPYVGYYLYKLLRVFFPDIPLMHAVSFTPLFIAVLSLIPFLFICHSLKISMIFSFIASVFLMLGRIFVKRSTYGWYDNDPYNILFPFIIILFVFYSIEKLKELNTKENFKYLFIKILKPILLISISIAIYALFWQGWVFVFSVIFSSLILIIIINHFLFKSSSKIIILFCGSLFIFVFCAVSLTFGWKDFFALFNEGWTALKNFTNPQLSNWPDIYISVSELRNASLSTIIELTGGVLFFIISIIGMIFSLKCSLRDNDHECFFKIIVLSVFLFGSIFITLGAQRFALLCVIPLSILFSLGLKHIFILFQTFIEQISTKDFHLKKTFYILLISLFISSVIIPIKDIFFTMPFLLNKIYNDTWDKVLKKIDSDTPENSIINTWWPPGHFIKSIAHRRVSFDGATINFPQAYWISNIFLSQTENEALGMLRMINNSANSSAEILTKIGVPLSKSISILKQITKLNRLEAHSLLEKGIPNQRLIGNLLSLTHSTPPPSYILIYNEFMDNNLQLPFIGNWDFQKVETINKNKNLTRNIPKRKSKEYIQFIWDLVGGPYKYSGILTQVARQDNKIIFNDNITIDIDTKDCSISSSNYGTGIPRSIFYLKNDKVIEKVLNNSSLNFSVLLIEENDSFKCILLDRRLAKSFLVNLYFFDAKGLKFVKPFCKEKDLTGRTQISVFEVDWNAFEKGNI